ncbi:5,10-methylene tetrahydromethanopterin reductase, partial [Streptomyces yanii]
VVPVLRKEFANGRPADVPNAPTHTARGTAAATTRGMTAA